MAHPWLLFAIAAILLPAIVHLPAVLQQGSIPGPDIKIHYRWALQFSDAIASGTFYPRWASYSYFGLGDPTFLYIHPLFYFITSAFHGLTSDLWLSLMATLVLASISSSVIGFLVLRQHCSARIAAVGSLVIALAPYSFHLAHFQQFLPMHFATPFLLLFVHCVLQPKSYGATALLAISTALLVTSHVLVAFMALLVFGVLTILELLIARLHFFPVAAHRGLGVAAGLLLSSAYLLPALGYQSLISPDKYFVPGALDWRNAFTFQWFTVPPSGFRWFHLQWTIALLTALILTIAFVLRSLISPQTQSSALSRLLAASVIALLLGSEMAYPLWEHMAVLQRLQFPVRFLSVASATSAFAFCIALEKSRRNFTLVVAIICVLTASLCFTAALELQRRAKAAPWNQVHQPSHSFSGEPEMLPASATRKWKEYVDMGGFQRECTSFGAICTAVHTAPHHKQWYVKGPPSKEYRLPLFAFPAWALFVNGESVPPEIDPEYGLLTALCETGECLIQARWNRLPLERAGLLISSLTALGLLFGLLVAGNFRNARDPLAKFR